MWESNFIRNRHYKLAIRSLQSRKPTKLWSNNTHQLCLNGINILVFRPTLQDAFLWQIRPIAKNGVRSYYYITKINYFKSFLKIKHTQLAIWFTSNKSFFKSKSPKRASEKPKHFPTAATVSEWIINMLWQPWRLSQGTVAPNGNNWPNVHYNRCPYHQGGFLE